MTRPPAFSFCHCCGTGLGNGEFPRICSGCGHMQFHNPIPIGVLIQPVTDGTRTGVLTPIRGINPQRGRPALTGGFQEATDHGSEYAGAREIDEEVGANVGLPRPNPDTLELLVSRAGGPFTPPGLRQNLVFSVNPNVLHTSVFDRFVPDEETLELHYSWEPEILAFNSHTYAMAKYFERYHGIKAPAHFLDQPRTGDIVLNGNGGLEVYDVPYQQPRLGQGVWMVKIEQGTDQIGVIRRGEEWVIA